jgi:hypothetical protein
MGGNADRIRCNLPAQNRDSQEGRLFAAAAQDDPNGVGEDFEIQGKRHVLDVDQIKAQALNHFIYIFSIAVLDLPPRCDAGPYLLKVMVMRRYGYDFLDVKRTLRARTDEGHFPEKDVEELGELVKTGLA